MIHCVDFIKVTINQYLTNLSTLKSTQWILCKIISYEFFKQIILFEYFLLQINFKFKKLKKNFFLINFQNFFKNFLQGQIIVKSLINKDIEFLSEIFRKEGNFSQGPPKFITEKILSNLIVDFIHVYFLI